VGHRYIHITLLAAIHTRPCCVPVARTAAFL